MSSPRRAHPYGRSADDVRRRTLRTRRTRRVRIAQLVVFAVLAVGLVGAGAYALSELREPAADPGVIAPKTFGEPPAEVSCPEPDAVPPPPAEVELRVLNGTTRSGLAGSVAEDLTERGYAVADVGNTSRSSGPATIVHGPEGYLAAQSVRVQLTGAQLRLDEREGASVDLLLGEGFTALEGADAAAAALDQPVEAPEGCE